MYLKVIVFSLFVMWGESAGLNNNDVSLVHTTIEKKNISSAPTITYTILEKPHHLFIGRCNPKYKVLHQEHVVVKNDGKSHVGAVISINIDGDAKISCVNIYDEMTDGERAYASYVDGGVGRNYIVFNVTTTYGKGFHFFVQIYGTDTS